MAIHEGIIRQGQQGEVISSGQMAVGSTAVWVFGVTSCGAGWLWSLTIAGSKQQVFQQFWAQENLVCLETLEAEHCFC